MPLSSIVSAAGSKLILVESREIGQVNRPFSSRFASTHTPEPSQCQRRGKSSQVGRGQKQPP